MESLIMIAVHLSGSWKFCIFHAKCCGKTPGFTALMPSYILPATLLFAQQSSAKWKCLANKYANDVIKSLNNLNHISEERKFWYSIRGLWNDSRELQFFTLIVRKLLEIERKKKNSEWLCVKLPISSAGYELVMCGAMIEEPFDVEERNKKIALTDKLLSREREKERERKRDSTVGEVFIPIGCWAVCFASNYGRLRARVAISRMIESPANWRSCTLSLNRVANYTTKLPLLAPFVFFFYAHQQRVSRWAWICIVSAVVFVSFPIACIRYFPMSF